MKKAVKRLVHLVCFGGICYLLGILAQKQEVQEKLFEVVGEDTYLAVLDKARVAGDILMWPVHYVKALLP